ncbi:MAG: hypothetical protein RIQ79_2209, partial [Verrucomicrobiota bacterium]
IAVRIVAVAAPVLPTVTLTATDASAGEFGADQALAFTVTRTGSTTAALSVPLTASGTATSGSDYSGFASSVTIPAGQASATLALTALPDTLAEGPETVILTLGASPDFTSGSPASASATITDAPRQNLFFALIADPAKRAPTDDADGDALPNLLEYFMGSDPANGAAGAALVIPSATPDTFTVRFPRALSRPDAIGTLQWSSDLVTWRTSGQSDGTRTVTFSEAVVSAPGADPETVESTATITGSPATPGVFVRLSVQ